MPRSLTQTAKAAFYSQETGEAVLILLTLSHADLPAPIRVTSDAVDTVSRGDPFLAFPFQITLPDDDDERPPEMRLTIDHVGREIVDAVRSINTPATVLLEIVLGSDTDTVEVAFPDFELVDVTMDALTVSGRLTLESFEIEPYPAGLMNPTDFPGLF